MAETATDVKTDSDLQLLNDNEIIIKPNKPIYFTCLQIRNLLKLQLLDLNPQNCVLYLNKLKIAQNRLVSSALELDNIEENFRNFWLADIMTAVVKNIQRTPMSVLQGTIVVGWISYFISLAVDEQLSKAKLFKTLYEYDTIGLVNEDEFMIPTIKDIPESPNYNICTTQNSKSKYDFNPTTPTSVTQSGQQILTFITNTIHDIFWDDFKYTVIQMAFHTEQPELPARPEAKTTQKINNLRQFGTTVKNEDEINDSDGYFKCAVLERYFFRKTNYNKSLLSSTDRLWSL